ncbi:DUF4232 domain-containing protein [Nocardioides sp.]|uniref:DUF4232 domain-containing protein n=1 Tax=Nocardioides sp. TaxID=35761 RepID=UPI002ED8764C
MKLLPTAAALGVLAAGLTVPGVTAGPTAGAAAPAPCTNAELTASYHGGDAAMSHRYGRIVLKNVSDHPCRTGGYGGLSYVGGGDGTQIGAPAERTPGRVRTFVVRPGQRLVSPVSETDATAYPKRRCRPAHVDGFRVYLPNETRSQYVEHPTTGCRRHRIHLLEHKPYRRP